ncbi:Acylphosphatase-2 [Acipenser ruthenus]|uniref:Acylphosphatase-2 n=1 Tax=Acipenser ruthenus TaxID=7906 RepID=A0A444UJ09_ACIRT|nr:Acylphosphatase-2 [Acipenser ruthenus]
MSWDTYQRRTERNGERLNRQDRRQKKQRRNEERRKKWLSTVGSPSSRIDRADFSNEKKISKLDFKGFSTRF